MMNWRICAAAALSAFLRHDGYPGVGAARRRRHRERRGDHRTRHRSADEGHGLDLPPADLPQQAIEQLIDDKVRNIEGRRLGMRVTDNHQRDMMNRLAGSARMDLATFEQNLARAGIEPDAVRDKISADAVWGELLRVRARGSTVTNAELNAELERRVAAGGARVTDYVIRQIIFVVPPGVSPGQRLAQANAARPRFTDCESGVDYMRTLPDVAVRERIGRTSTELQKQTADLLAKTPVGR